MAEQTRSDSHGAKPAGREVRCPVDDTAFVQKRPWQKFCSNDCKNNYHRSMSPEALRRDLDQAIAVAKQLRADHDELKQRVDQLEAAIAKVPA